MHVCRNSGASYRDRQTGLYLARSLADLLQLIRLRHVATEIDVEVPAGVRELDPRGSAGILAATAVFSVLMELI